MSITSTRVLDLQPNFSRKAHLNLPATFKHIVGQFNNLREINLSYCDDFDDEQLELLSPMRKNIRILKLRGTSITDEGVMSFLEYEKCMNWYKQHASMMESPVKKCEIGPRPCSPLEVLDLSATMPDDDERITNKSLLAVAYTCLDLKHLSLSMRSGIDGTFLNTLPLFLRKLAYLDVSMTSILSTAFCHLAHLPALREVDISACKLLSGDAINSLVTGIPHCSHVHIRKSLVTYMTWYIAQSRGNGSGSQLRAISARFAKDIDANLLDSLTKEAPHLKTLDLRHYQGNDLKTGLLSPLKMSLRKLQQNGVEVALSRV